MEPPWEAPLDAERALASIPADAKISGMFFVALLAGAKTRNVVLPSARERYVPFNFYPVADLGRLLFEAAQRFYAGRPLRQALRALGRAAPGAFLSSTLGRVTLGSTEGVHAAVAAMANAYDLNLRPSRVSTLDSGPDWAVVRLDKVFYFVDSHHVGSFEGILRFAGVTGTVRIASRGSASADLLLAWDAAP
ncbi:MAG TPA: DUF2378 family protein [Polyangiaceae bacterium]|jgi:uncharacterized protein (TIGR02265 family)|nr:DUF2378 family protein [Polyangiaceae bacterium]